MKFKVIFGILILIILLATPATVYFYYFHNQSVSDKSGDWGSFGDFLNPFITVINLVVVAYFSYRILKLEEGRDNITRPVLVFRPDTFEQVVFWNQLVISNIGKTIAFNIRIKVFEGENYEEHHIPVIADNREEKIFIKTSKWGRCEIAYEDPLKKSFATSITNPTVIQTLTKEEMDILFLSRFQRLINWFKNLF